VAYCSSKAALINMGRVLAVEWGPLNIRVNAVCPTFIVTPLTKPLFDANPDFSADVAQRTLLPALPEPADIAQAVVYLASARSVTGQCLTVDAGWTAH
jgi:2-deoxy-D-gluconate 3-dehydrogenase